MNHRFLTLMLFCVGATALACSLDGDDPGTGASATTTMMASSSSGASGGEESSSGHGPDKIDQPDLPPPPNSAAVGDLRKTQWWHSHYQNCGEAAAILCVQYQVSDESPYATPDRVVFVTPSLLTAEIKGFVGAATHCRLAAEKAKLPGWYVPFIGSVDTVPAIWYEDGYAPGHGKVGTLEGLELENDGWYITPTGNVLSRSLTDSFAGSVMTADNTIGNPIIWTALNPDMYIDDAGAVDAFQDMSEAEQAQFNLDRTCQDWGSLLW